MIEGVVARWISLFILFPALLGVAAGAAGSAVIGKLKLRAPAIAFLLGAVGGVAGYAAEHVTVYCEFRARAAEVLEKQNTPAAEVQQRIDELLTSVSGSGGFRGYLTLAAHNGITIKNTGSPGESALKIADTWAWVLWAVELVLGALIAGLITRKRAQAAFCEDCIAWYGAEATVASNGSGRKDQHKQMMVAIERGDLPAAATAFFGAKDKSFTFQLTEQTCPSCHADMCFQAYRVNFRRRNNPRNLLDRWLMSRAEREQLKTALAVPAMANAAGPVFGPRI